MTNKISSCLFIYIAVESLSLLPCTLVKNENPIAFTPMLNRITKHYRSHFPNRELIHKKRACELGAWVEAMSGEEEGWHSIRLIKIIKTPLQNTGGGWAPPTDLVGPTLQVKPSIHRSVGEATPRHQRVGLYKGVCYITQGHIW